IAIRFGVLVASLSMGCDDSRIEAVSPADGGVPAVSDLALADQAASDAVPSPPDLEPQPLPPQTFAVIGDYGSDDGNELQVAQLVKSWNPDFVLTTGDNVYPGADYDNIDLRIGKYYAEFI